MTNLTIRRFKPSDENFLYDTWLKSFKESPFGKRITYRVYFEMQRARINNILARGAHALIACAPDDEDQIIGFLVYEDHDDSKVVHYIFTKKLYQRMGVARALFKAAEINIDCFEFTHLNTLVENILGAKLGLGSLYNPYRT